MKKRAKPQQHTRRTKSGKLTIVNKGVTKSKIKGAGKEYEKLKSPFISYDYDPHSKELVLEFPNGALYRYYGVPKTIEKKISENPYRAMGHIRKTYIYAPENRIATAAFNRANKKRNNG